MGQAERLKTFCFDLDGTLCTNTWGDYEHAQPFPWAIARVNGLAAAGHRVLIFTARGSTTGIDWRPTTEAQLQAWGVRYDELILGKPQADVYVDDRTVHVDAWRYGEAFSVPPRDPSGQAREPAEEALPVLPPPRSPTLVEIGRTFKGEPFRLEAHARRVIAAADEHEIVHVYSEAEICDAVLGAIEPTRDRLAATDDLIFTIALGGPPQAGYLDTVEDGLDATLTIGCRLLGQAAAGLTRYFRDGAIVAGSVASSRSVDTWPLGSDGAGTVCDMLGGEVVASNGDELRVRPQRGNPPIALAVALESAADLGLRVRETASTAAELGAADELLLIDLPFCVLPVGALDDRPLAPAPGPVAVALANAWKKVTGYDPASDWRR
jgi:hypothetical protein